MLFYRCLIRWAAHYTSCPRAFTDQASMVCRTLTRAEHTALPVLPAELRPRQSTMAAGWTTVTDAAGCKARVISS